jgi:redox-sensitive bicupin YhaK (pirin superfamily)
MKKAELELGTNDISVRRIIHRSRGRGDGSITRLVSPSDIGELIKPFVFLDRFHVAPIARGNLAAFLGDGYHPHSGIATLTTLLSGEIYYEDTTGRAGTLSSGGIEYMQSGTGVWHTGGATGTERATGFQLWVALPPELEGSPAKSMYLSRKDVPSVGPIRVILGSYNGLRSLIAPGSPMNYLYVSLRDGERWTYETPDDHDIAWVAVHEGELHTGGVGLGAEIAVFEESHHAIEFTARGKTGFVLGTARKHPHPLILGRHSVHTNHESLKSGAIEIGRIWREKLKHITDYQG